MKTFENVSSLKDATLRAGQLVETKGYYSAGDGGGGRYLIKDTAIVDGYVNHSLAGGTYAILDADEVLRVELCGAVPGVVCTANIQAALDMNFLRLVYTNGASYTQGSVSVPSGCIIEGNNAKIIPDANPAQCFLVDTDYATNFKSNIRIHDFVIDGSVVDFIKVTGSGWMNLSFENINSVSGGGNSLIKTSINTDWNPSGIRIKDVRCLRSNVYQYCWHAVATSTTASIDHVDIDTMNIWSKASGWCARIEHKLSNNSFVTKLYNGASSMVGGGALYVSQMEGGRVGQLWTEGSNGDVSVLSGSYRDVVIDYLQAQTNTATESADTKLFNGHAFNCEFLKINMLDGNTLGYERDTTPPSGYMCLVFTDDASGHISRDVRIHNEKGNFGYSNITGGEGIRLIKNLGSDLVFCEHQDTSFTSATVGIGTADTVSLAEFTNWEWGIDGEGLEIIISGNVVGSNSKDFRFGLDSVNVVLGVLAQPAEGAFILHAICQPHNDGADRIRVQSTVSFNDCSVQKYTNAGNTWIRGNRTSHIYVYAPTLNDTVTVNSVVVKQLRSTVR